MYLFVEINQCLCKGRQLGLCQLRSWELNNIVKYSFQLLNFISPCLVGIVELIAVTIAHAKKNVALKYMFASSYRLLRSLKHDINQKELHKISQIFFDHHNKQTGQ